MRKYRRRVRTLGRRGHYLKVKSFAGLLSERHRTTILEAANKRLTVYNDAGGYDRDGTPIPAFRYDPLDPRPTGPSVGH